jgi:dihydrofolate synthase/folylpolyglutamate synthase
VIGVNGLDITAQNIKAGLENAKNPARTEVLCASPLILLDGSHNDDSTKALANVLQTYLPGQRILAVMGMMADKDVGKAIENLKEYFSHVVAVTPTNPRAMPARDFSELLLQNGVSAEACDDPTRGVERAIELLKCYDALVICGSLYLAADVRAYLISKIKELL